MLKKKLNLKIVWSLSLCLWVHSNLATAAIGMRHLAGEQEQKKGDAHYRLRADLSEAQLALSHYEQFLKLNPNKVEALWKVSMACHFLGMRTPDEEKKQVFFLRGIEAGEKSVNLAPDCAPCHFWLGINHALYGESVGILKMISTLSTVEGHLKQCSELDPTYAEGGGYRILGIINQKVPGILGGSEAEAIKYFQKAIAAAPRDPMNYLFLAKLLSEDEENLEKALQVMTSGLKHPMPSIEYVESREARIELEKLEKEIQARVSNKAAH